MPASTVLIVDDTRSERVLLRHALSGTRRNLRIVEAGNRSEAVDQYNHHDVDVVFLDIVLPGRSGIDVLGELRRIDPDSFVVMISHHNTQDHVVKALRHGAKGFVVKPFSLAKINTVFNQYDSEARIPA